MAKIEDENTFSEKQKEKILKTLKRDKIFLFGQRSQHMVGKDLTIYINEKEFCKCKDIDEAIKVINYYY